MLNSKADLNQLKQQLTHAFKKEKFRINICAGLGCVAKGSLDVYEEFKKVLAQEGLDKNVDLFLHQEQEGVNTIKTGCIGLCEAGPVVMITPGDILYVKVTPADVPAVVNLTIKQHKLVESILPQTSDGKLCKTIKEVPFYAKQQKIALRNCGSIDPTDIRDYIAHDGYQALSKVLFEMTPESLVDMISESNLRGRGGGGFPTGRKWKAAQIEKDPVKYIVVNADEGDPGAFMDRSVLEGDPHTVIEGAAVAAYAIGAREAYVYVRAEYPLAVERLKIAIQQATDYNLLGDHVLGSDFAFHLKIKEGAGAFVCGEETALLSSIEGERGMPKPKPPFPAQKGLWGHPTIINNVETMAFVSPIVLNGAAWFKSFGTPSSPGTKTFALSGKLKNTGLVEVPFGTTLRELVFDMGGGIIDNNQFKAAQIGGPSGGCLTVEHLDMPMDYDSLQKAGAIVGSGGLVICDDKTCIVEMARFFMNFTQSESCGKCIPCREGTNRMLEIMERIVHGEGTMEDLDLLKEIAGVVKDGSLCGLGKTAPNPVLSTLKYFPEEYESHIKDQVCPAKQCKDLEHYYIKPELCRGCMKCAKECPSRAILGVMKEPFVILQDRCTKCGHCITVCPFNAIYLS
ncbi:MAG: NADH-quinone oxidoreductase subunit NuoF [Candidatus Delongbacteria bacterium]|nr:NADH-quinone oxidoreductase subunit NuoF [Candidatus Delongbacteria bacterium]